MTADPVTVDADAPLGDVARVLLERSFNSVPVVVTGGALVGMIGRADLALLAEG
jgi:CBS domain-containing protein